MRNRNRMTMRRNRRGLGSHTYIKVCTPVLSVSPMRTATMLGELILGGQSAGTIKEPLAEDDAYGRYGLGARR